ncbi:MAG: hypothetical protein SFY81_10390 [Verrucomicrobiota bacterium]|nr:hypothetical protein [Verrucomicrobiota bacterium]
MNSGREIILIVSEKPELRSMASIILAQNGYSSLTSPGVDEAIRLSSEHIGDIRAILLDLEFNQISMPTVIKTFHKLDPRVIIIGTGGSINDRRASLCDAFLHQPFTSRRLLQVIEPCIESKYQDKGVA